MCLHSPSLHQRTASPQTVNISNFQDSDLLLIQFIFTIVQGISVLLCKSLISPIINLSEWTGASLAGEHGKLAM